jgi:hypothetical protein
MEIVGGTAAEAHLARFTTSSPPRLLSQRIVNYLEREKARYALERLRVENHLLDDIEAEAESLDARIFKAAEIVQNLRVDLAAAQQVSEQRRMAAVGVSETESRFREVSGRLIDLRSKRSALGARARPLMERAAACSTFLMQGIIGKPLKFSEPVAPGKATLRQVRDHLAELRTDLADVTVAPLPASIARQRLVKWIDARATPINARPLLGSLIAEDGASLPYVARQVQPTSGGGGVETVNALGLVCWLLKDELIKELGEQIDRAARPEEALSPEEQAKKIKDLKARIEEAEANEEALAWSLLQAGKEVELRGDAAPQAILCARVNR